MNDATEEKLAGKMVICVSHAGRLRGYRCDWWAVEACPQNPPAMPRGVRVFTKNAAFLAATGREGITQEDLHAAVMPRELGPVVHLSADALRLASHLGHRDIEVWGADWRGGGKTLSRWVRESQEWWSVIQQHGLTVTRNGKVMNEVPCLAFDWRGGSRDDLSPALQQLRNHLSQLQSPHTQNGDLLVTEPPLPHERFGGGSARFWIMGGAASAAREAVDRLAAEGRLPVEGVRLSTMYELPSAAAGISSRPPKAPHRPQRLANFRDTRAERLGPGLWARFHARPAAFTGNVVAELAWLDAFASRAPCRDCRRHWRELVAKMPPDLTSASAYHRWTVDAHNAVNLRLGKPVWAGMG
jgi:hypothetical protein